MASSVCKVFISSTKEDLELYRNAAKEAAIRAGMLPVMMDYFLPGGGRPLVEECMAKVDGCDVLVVIVAHRYGWVPGPGEESITWLECKRAKTLIAFLVDEKHPWPAELRESYRLAKAAEEGKFTPELAAEVSRNIARLEEFKRWLSSRDIRLTFTNPDGLRGDVEASLREWLAARGPEGREYPWGDEPPDPERANYEDTRVGRPTPVGLFPRGETPDGIQDLAGNVCEWVAGESRGKEHGVRGAGFVGGVEVMRAATRFWFDPRVRIAFFGFRCVRETTSWSFSLSY